MGNRPDPLDTASLQRVIAKECNRTERPGTALQAYAISACGLMAGVMPGLLKGPSFDSGETSLNSRQFADAANALCSMFRPSEFPKVGLFCGSAVLEARVPGLPAPGWPLTDRRTLADIPVLICRRRVIWHSSRLNNCLTCVTKEKKASDKGIRQNLQRDTSSREMVSTIVSR